MSPEFHRGTLVAAVKVIRSEKLLEDAVDRAIELVRLVRASAPSVVEPAKAEKLLEADELIDWLSDVGDFLDCLKMADPTTRDALQLRRQRLVEFLESSPAVEAKEPQ